MEDLSLRSKADFNLARLKGFFSDLISFFRGQPNDLLSFNDVKGKLRLGGPIYRGVKAVPVKNIIGSVNRYRDFDRAFLPTQNFTSDRWEKVNRAFYDDFNLPPILLYKVGEVYFVMDGNHRVSVARERGIEFIEADVRECAVRVPVTADLRAEDLELLGAKVDFLERVPLDRVRPEAQIELTILGGYDRLLEHIAVHKYFMGLDFKHDISDDEAIGHWYDTVYLPVVQAIQPTSIMTKFPDRTITDLYLWVIDHQHFLREHDPDVTAQEAAAHFAENYFRAA